jgi:ATP-binding cassette, subfamily B, multidrug efflux pump
MNLNGLRHVREYLIKSRGRYALGIMTLIAVDTILLIPPKLLGTVVDNIRERHGSPSELMAYPLLLVLVAVVVSILRFGWRMIVTGESRRMEYWLRNKLFVHLTRMDSDFYSRRKTGDLMAHFTNDLNSLRGAMGIGIIILTDSIFVTLTTVSIMAFTIDPMLTLMSLVPLPVVAVFMFFTGKNLQSQFRDVQDEFSAMSDCVQESFSGVRVVKSYIREQSEMDRFEEVNSSYMRKNMKLIRIWGLIFPLIGFVMSLCYAISLFYGGRLIVAGTISLGQFMSFVTYLGMLTFPVMSVGWISSLYQRGKASIRRINILLDTVPSIADDESCEEPEEYSTEIEFRNVSFSYPDSSAAALSGVSFKLEKGRSLGIVGSTGSGKSTLISLMMRMYDPDAGQVLFSGKDLRTLPLAFIRRSMGAVMQDPFLFSETVRENIAFANPSLNLERVAECAAISGIARDIEGFSDGYDTLIGERGVTLSGGQKQRISIGRAIAMDPDVLILDDCLSAVDTKTESEILEKLRSASASKTTVIVAHRISTVRECDNIIVMRDGSVVEEGTHESLVSLGGEYAMMNAHQLLEEKISGYEVNPNEQ